MAPGQAVLRRRLRRFGRRHRPAIPHHGFADRRLAGSPRPCHPTVVTGSRVRAGPRRHSRSQGPATCRRRGTTPNTRTRRRSRQLTFGGLVVPRRRATTHETARRRSAGQAGARPAGGQHRVRPRRSVRSFAFGAARPAPPDRRDHQGTTGHRHVGRIRHDHRPHLGFRRRSCCLFYRIPGRPFAAIACLPPEHARPNRR